MKLIFSTGNLLRKTGYRIITSVYEYKGKYFVRKTACTNEAQEHIENIYQLDKIVKQKFRHLKFPKILRKNKHYIDYEYIDSPTLIQLIENRLFRRDYKQAAELVKTGIDAIDKIPGKLDNPYKSEEFKNLFDGQHKYQSKEAKECVDTAVPDLRFANMILKNKEVFLIDCEWVYNCPLPKDYLKFRSLFFLCLVLQTVINTLCSKDFPCRKVRNNLIIPAEWYDLIKSNSKDIESFLHYESNFQNRINIPQGEFHRSSVIKGKLILTSGLNTNAQTSLLEQSMAKLQNDLDLAYEQLDNIKSSRFFRLWQKYTSARDDFRYKLARKKIKLFSLLALFCVPILI